MGSVWGRFGVGLGFGIYGSELWALLMATRISDPFNTMLCDCLSVQKGAQLGRPWSNSPKCMLSKIWAPTVAALDDNPERLLWNPAHVTAMQLSKKRLSNGCKMKEEDRQSNSVVDLLAKQAAEWDQVPKKDVFTILRANNLLNHVARWIGQCAYLANNFKLPGSGAEVKHVTIRDSTDKVPGLRKSREAKVKLAGNTCNDVTPGKDLFSRAAAVSASRLHAMHDRVLKRPRDTEDPAAPSCAHPGRPFKVHITDDRSSDSQHLASQCNSTSHNSKLIQSFSHVDGWGNPIFASKKPCDPG